MLRLGLITALPVFIASFTAAHALQPEPEGSDLATQLKALTEEVRRLNLKVIQLEEQVADLQAESRQAGLMPFQTPPTALGIIPRQPLILEPPLQWDFPPVELRPTRDLLPWNYDTGLYVFPELNPPAAK
jgi:hypothetical protein